MSRPAGSSDSSSAGPGDAPSPDPEAARRARVAERARRRREVRASSAVAIGQLVAGRYRVEDKLGEGGMAEVFRAADQASGRAVALKVLHPQVATNPEAVERTRREGQVLSGLRNPAIVDVETFGELEDGTVFLVMELLEGETLGDRMRRGPLDPVDLVPIVAGTCAGLHAAHQRGVVHRDLKPDNIFLCPTDHGVQVKLLDFGISKVYGEQKLTRTGEVLGTPRYMSPEQLGAEPDVDGRVDVYALGVILYEALAGKPPFLAATPTDLIIAILNGKVVPLTSARSDVPPPVEAVVMRAMSRTRDARFETPMALAEAFVDAAGGPPRRAPARRGVATVAMGGMQERPDADAATVASPAVAGAAGPPAPDPVAGNLRIGTFSGLPEADAGAAIPPPKGTQQMGASPGPALPAAPGSVAPLAPEQVPETVPPRAIPPTSSPEDPRAEAGPSDAKAAGAYPIPKTPVPPRRVAATAMMDPSLEVATSAPVAPVAPRSGGVGRAVLVLGALLAGAASAGAVILTLQALEEREAVEDDTGGEDAAGEGAAGEDASGEDEERGPEAGEPEAGEAAEAPEGAEAPDGVEPPPDAVAPATEPSGAAAPRRTAARRRRRRRGGARSSATPALRGRSGEPTQAELPEPSGPSEPASPLQRARAAQRAGQLDRCVEILDEAIRGGAAAIALRRRADCYEAAGRRAEAVRDYQRFCRLVPDHPAISEVRPLLEGWGQRCP